MSDRAEYRTANNWSINQSVNRDAFCAVEHVPAAMYSPATEAAAMQVIGHAPECNGAVTETDFDEDVVTPADIARLSAQIESGAL